MARWRSWLAGALLLALAAPAAVHAEWDAGDVEAAESYREAERDRALRYRARVEREAPPPPRSGLPVPTAREERGASTGPTRHHGDPGDRVDLAGWLGSEWNAAVALWHAGQARLRAWQASWEEHGAPRVGRWRAVLGPAASAGAARADEGFLERLLRAAHEEIVASRAGGRRER